MAMTGSGMGASIKTQVEAISGITIVDDAALTAFCNAVGVAVVSYIQSNAVVNVASVSGVQTGPSNSGPGTGSVT
jgi:hypothetical protein